MDIDIEQFLQNWYDTKTKIADLQRKLDKYKKVADKIMTPNAGDQIRSRGFVLTKKVQSRKTISKSTVPNEVWENYSKRVDYPVFYIKKVK